MCKRCLSQVGRGMEHNCTLTQRRQNLGSGLFLDPRGAEILASDAIKAKASVASGNCVGSMQLATRGAPLTVTIGSQANNSAKGTSADRPVPAKEISRFQQAIGLSRNQTARAATFLRYWMGSNAVEPGLERQLQLQDRTLENFFCVAHVDMKTGRETTQRRAVAYCTDPAGLIQRVLHQRQVSPNEALVKIGIDGGGGFMKVCLSVVPISENFSEQPPRSRFARAVQFKDSGVKKLLLLALVEDVDECYENLQALLQLLDLQAVSFVCAVDMKLANTVLGLQTCSSTHPCPWCEMHRADFGVSSRRARLRSLGTIRQNAIRYQQAAAGRGGRSKPSAAEFMNCVQLPLLDLMDNTLVTDIIPPIELHLMLGIVNKLFDELDSRLRAAAGCGMQAADWAQRLNLRKPQIQGGQYAGNDCARLLDGADILEQMLHEASLPIGMPVVRALRCFREVKRKCFGQELHSDFELAIAAFADAYAELGIGFTPKVHAVLCHVAPFLNAAARQPSTSARCGLGFWSEQASEAQGLWQPVGQWLQGQPLPPAVRSAAAQLRGCVLLSPFVSCAFSHCFFSKLLTSSSFDA